MNKHFYNALGFIPIIGSYIQSKSNFFAFKGSAYMSEFMKTDDYKILSDWMKKNPNKILSHDMAKKLIGKK